MPPSQGWYNQRRNILKILNKSKAFIKFFTCSRKILLQSTYRPIIIPYRAAGIILCFEIFEEIQKTVSLRDIHSSSWARLIIKWIKYEYGAKDQRTYNRYKSANNLLEILFWKMIRTWDQQIQNILFESQHPFQCAVRHSFHTIALLWVLDIFKQCIHLGYRKIRYYIRKLSLLHIHEWWKPCQIKATELTEVFINNFIIDHCMLSRV